MWLSQAAEQLQLASSACHATCDKQVRCALSSRHCFTLRAEFNAPTACMNACITLRPCCQPAS